VGEARFVRRATAALLAALVLASCGGSKPDVDKVALRKADAALSKRPTDARALAGVVRAAYLGASHRYDIDTGGFRSDARSYLDRAAAVWPNYERAAGRAVSGDLAAVMVQVYGEGLDRAPDAAAAAHIAATKKPTSAAYLQETVWAARAGDRKRARIAGEQALELAAPADRDRVRAGIDQALGNAP
jgi:hypothetical protein